MDLTCCILLPDTQRVVYTETKKDQSNLKYYRAMTHGQQLNRSIGEFSLISTSAWHSKMAKVVMVAADEQMQILLLINGACSNGLRGRLASFSLLH
jgi:hypothetical protein